MRTVDDALELLARAAGTPRASPETVPLAEALGRVLAADVPTLNRLVQPSSFRRAYRSTSCVPRGCWLAGAWLRRIWWYVPATAPVAARRLPQGFHWLAYDESSNSSPRASPSSVSASACNASARSSVARWYAPPR